MNRSSILVTLLLVTACDSNQSPGTRTSNSETPLIQSQYSYQDLTGDLTHGIAGDRSIDSSGQHHEVVFRLSDAEFSSFTVEGVDGLFWESKNNSILLSIHLYSASKLEFQSGDYGFADPDQIRQGNTQDTSVFSLGYVGLDFDLSGNVEDSEMQEVIAGNVIVTGSGISDTRLEFNLILATGESISGFYNSGFTIVDT